MSLKLVTEGRYSFSDPLSISEVDALLADTSLKVLQTSLPVSEATWDVINRQILPVRPEIEIRVFGHYGDVCDLSFLRRLGNVQHLSLDCLRDATGIQTLVELTLLRSLHIGIYSLESFDFLREVCPDRLRLMSLLATASKKPHLDVLERFPHISTLYLEGQQKGIEVIADLNELEDLTLRSVTVKSFAFLRGLSQLWSLDLKLGGSNDLSALAGMSGLKYLELWQIRGLKDLSPIGQFTGLQFLFLQSLAQVKELPDFSALVNLRRLYLETMRGLTSLAPVTRAPALQDFMFIAPPNFEPDDVRPILGIKTLRHFQVGLGMRKNESLHADVRAAGVATGRWPKFEFV